MMGAIGMEPFEVEIDGWRLEDLKERLRRTRWAPEVDNDDWKYGTSGRYLKALVDYWIRDYDWRAQEERINRFRHFRTMVDGIPVHFIHERGTGPSPLPLVLSHGWPWTFWDWHELIGPLTDPAAYGGDPADAFDVIVPSLPGFAFSAPLNVTGITPVVVAGLWHRLLHDGLGYERFGAGGGDWGSFVSAELGIQFPDSLVGVYLSYPPRFHVDLENLPPDTYTAEEASWREQQAATRPANLSHVAVHSHGPQSLAWALNDSPVGLAGWLLERRFRWSDCGGDLESTFSRDFLLTTLSLYWLTETIGSSIRMYADSFGHGFRVHSSDPPGRIEVPTGIGVFPRDLALVPRSACERAANLVHWSLLPEGGHFGPSEQPALYLDELRTFFRPLRVAS